MPTIDDAVRAYEAKDYAATRAICLALGAADRHSRFLLGIMASYGEGEPSNPRVAAEHYLVAAEAGHGGAMFNLAAMHAQGRGVPRDFTQALLWYERAADAGDADALFQIGAMHANGEGVPIDLQAAGNWWERGAERGEARSMHFLGRLLADGDGGRPRDPGLAAYWFFKAWQGGIDDAEQDIIRIRAALEAAAESGSAEAQTALGLLLCFGHNAAADAAEWFERAAAQDHPEALRTLGFLVEGGKGMPPDDARAADLYRRAAELGDKFAQFNYAIMLEQSRGGLSRDINAAILWLRRAKQGLDDANQPLAELLAERNRDRRDANEAIQRLVQAARAAPEQTFRLVAGDASWSVTVANGGTAVSLVGIRMDELVGLPDEDD